MDGVGSDDNSDEEKGMHADLFFFLCRIVIRINHVLDADESNHIMLTNYRVD